MAEYVRPAASASWFEQEDTEEWEIYEEEPLPLASQHLAEWLDPHLPYCEPPAPYAVLASRPEARIFWMDGGWDDLADAA